jgi:undecaprenyl-phosphate galactose phosphotransferase
MHGAVAFGPVLAVFPLFTVLAILANHGARRLLVHVASWTIPVVILGNGAAAAVAEAAVNADRSLGYHVVGRMDPAAMMASATAPTLLPVLKRFGGSRLLIALDGAEKLQRQLIEGALREGLPFGVVQQPGAFPAFAADTTQFFNHETTLVSCRSELSRPLSQVMKAVMDVGLAALLLILMAPLFIMLTVACRRDGGPAIFAHRRVGVGGRSFPCLKFRTMVVNGAQVLEEALASDPALAEEWAATRKLTHDPRVTPIGRFLRKTSLDELPQLINVLIRQMSLVGPRPIVEAEIHLYGKDIAHYYATRPGLTGLWQVSGRSNTSYARRVELDVRYVTNWTIWHDLVVLLKTIPAVLRRDGAC